MWQYPLGLVWVCMVIFFIVKSIESILSAKRRIKVATGTVAGHVLYNRGMMMPKVEFQTPEGQSIEFTSGLGGRVIRYPEGSQIPVCYDPSNPNNAEIAISRIEFVSSSLGIGLVLVSCSFVAIRMLIGIVS